MKVKDPVSGLTHLVGAVLGVFGIVALVVAAARWGTARHVVSYAVFGASIVLLYSASAVYHLVPLPWSGPTSLLRRLDHTMIFVLIAGTYTPLCLVTLRGGMGTTLLVVVWSVAAIGALVKLFLPQAPRWISTGFYVGMGWLVVGFAWPLASRLSPHAIEWFVAGGLFYTVGALVYASKRPDPLPRVLGFHEVFHLLVMAGSASHFWATLRYVW